MNTLKPIWCAGLLFLTLGGTLSAQETDFDLSTQRSESQQVPPVPGHKRDHGGIVVNPTPHRMQLDTLHWLDISQGLRLKDRQRCFDDDLGFVRLAAKGPQLDIDFGEKAASRRGVKSVSGAYALDIDAKGVRIVGYDERGAFYGIQTLRQLLESPATAGVRLPYARIDDHPDLPNRGVVEGFYGTPWSHEVRLSLIDFYGRFKMNTYLYGPKDDPYHSCPNWRLPYPEQEAAQIRELVEACRRNRVDFVWAIHPGQDIRWDETDYRNLVGKFERMYDLGVRSFAIFFDDISGEGTDPRKQTALLNRLMEEFVEAKGDVAPLTVCPTDYSRLWANPTPQGSLAIYGETLHPAVKVFWTGDVVCSDLTRETLSWVNSRIRRPAYFWWNFPVTDYVRHIVLQGPTYGLDTTLSEREVCGIASNPMEHGEASKLALYGVADYAWNIAAYDALDNWERGLGELVPEAREAYRTFAIHSADTENGYRRDESWETRTFRLDEWTDAAAAALRAELERVEQAPAILEAKCSNRALLNELRPWLAEFTKLGARGRRTLDLMEAYRADGDVATLWAQYADNRMSDADRRSYEAHRSGTMKLQPFYEEAMEEMGHGLLTRLMGAAPMTLRGIGSFASARTPQTRLMFDNDSTTFYTSGIAQKPDDWIGVDLGGVHEVREVSILQGRNSTDDVDYFDHAVLEYSADGRTWHPLLDELTRQYVIRWTGEAVSARYVRLRRLDSKRTNYAAIRTFEVNPLRVADLGFPLEADDAAAALRMFDGRPDTSYAVDDTLTFGLLPGTKSCTLLMGRPASPVEVEQLAADGATVVARSVAADPFCRIEVAEGAAGIRVKGAAEIFEIVMR